MYKSANDLYLGIKTTEHIYTNIYIYSIGYDFICALIFFLLFQSFIEVLCLQLCVGYQVRSHVNLWQAMLNDAAISAANWHLIQADLVKTPGPTGPSPKKAWSFLVEIRDVWLQGFWAPIPFPQRKNMGVNIPMNWVGLKEISFPKHHGYKCRFGSMMNFQGVSVPSEAGPQNYGNVRLG